MGKITCLVGCCPGFVANRVMSKSGASALVQSGVLPEHVDAASEAFGMRMGPFGQKNGKGYYKYDDKRKLSKDPEAEALIQNVWSNLGVKQCTLDQESLVQELYLPVIN